MWADPQSHPPIRAKQGPHAGAAETGASDKPMRAPRAAHEGPDERGQGQNRVPARRPVRQIRRSPGRPRRVRAGGQRRDGNLDHLSRHQELAQRRHEREGGSDRQADPAIPVRPRTPDLLGDARQRHQGQRSRNAGTAPRRLCAAFEPGAFGQPALLHQPPGSRTNQADPPHIHARKQHRLLARRQVHRNRLARHQLRAGLLPR